VKTWQPQPTDLVTSVQREGISISFQWAEYSSVAGYSISEIVGPDLWVAGTLYDDTLRMTDFGEQISGRGGHDTIEGRGGKDSIDLSSGTTADIIYTDLNDLEGAGFHDLQVETIQGFGQGSTLDFSAIEGLTFIGKVQFTGSGTAELRYDPGSGSQIEFDANGDGIADHFLQVNGVPLYETAPGSRILTSVQPNLAPTITSDGGDQATITVPENTVTVTTVLATDLDAGDTLTYSIVPAESGGGADAARFTIDAATGVLSFVTSPDYESPMDAGSDNIYNVTVQVSDGKGGLDTQAIAIAVSDVDEGSTTPPADTTADMGGDLAVSIEDGFVGDAGKAAVAYTVSGLDADATATVTFSGLDKITGVTKQVIAANGTVDLTGFQDGTITASITATDTAGNTATGTGDTIALDTTTPVPVIANIAKTATGIAFSGTSEALSTVRLYKGTQLVGTAVTDSVGKWTLVAGSLSDETHTFTATATDPAGNTGTSGLAVYGSSKADGLMGALSDDLIIGNGGNDSLNGGLGFDLLYGGSELDTADYRGTTLGAAVDLTVGEASGAEINQDILFEIENVQGGSGNDTLIGNAEANLLSGNGGNDTVAPYAGNDTVLLGDGNDIVLWRDGRDAGNDTIHAGAGINWIEDFDGNNTITAGDDGNTIRVGFFGRDVITTGAGDDNILDVGGGGEISAGDGNNRVHTGNGDHTILTGSGNDTIETGNGTIRVNAGSGINRIWVPNAVATITGGSGVDSVGIALGTYTIDVGDGENTISGYGGNVTITSGSGGDTIDIANGITVVDAGDGENKIRTGDGADHITAGLGKDLIEGRAGDDVIDAGADTDTVVYSGNRSDYLVTQNADGSYSIADTRTGSPDGTDTVRNIELFAFADSSVPLAELLNKQPVITSDGGGETVAATVLENGTAVTTVTATDPDAGQTLNYAIAGGADATRFTINSSTGVLAFTASPDFEAPVDANGDNVYEVSIQVSDGSGGTDRQVITVSVGNQNEAPVAPETLAGSGVQEDAAASVVATLVATDVDGDVLTYSVSDQQGGTFSRNPTTGEVTFIPTAHFNGTASATYTVSDGVLTDTGVISVAVAAVNDAPTAASTPENTSGTEDIRVTGTLLAGSDVDGDALTFLLGTTPAAGGVVTIDAHTGSYTFTPTANFNGTASFTYVVSDGVLQSAEKTIQIAIAPVNDAPVANVNGIVDAYSFTKGGTKTLAVASDQGVLKNDADVVEGSPLTVQLVQTTANGSLVLNADGSFSYTPNNTFMGTDSFTYLAVDSEGGQSEVTTVQITVLSGGGTTQPDRPVSRATEGNDNLRGTVSSDTINALGGNDRIEGLGSNDFLTGGAGDDAFIFAKDAGADTLTDFDLNGNDVVELVKLGKALDTYAELQPYLSEIDGNAVLDLSASVGIKILFQGTALSQIGADDFRFV
jgi:Ca2+-binding RTX toxin-like protein